MSKRNRRSSDQYDNGAGLVWAIVICLVILLLVGCGKAEASNSKLDLDNFWIKVGAGYKFEDSVHTHKWIENGEVKTTSSDPISARIELIYKYDNNLSFGIAHHSQWLTGFPFNNDRETSKTEFFIDYTFNLGELF